jgi:hypothetical protein
LAIREDPEELGDSYRTKGLKVNSNLFHRSKKNKQVNADRTVDLGEKNRL